MKDDRIKEQLFRSVREALIEHNNITDSDMHTVGNTQASDGVDELFITFAQNFTRAGGTVHYCYKESDIRDRLLEIQQQNGNTSIGCASENLAGFLSHLKVENSEPKDSPLVAILCEALIAGQGGIVISSNLGLGTTIPALPEKTIIIAFTSQVVTDWEAANERLKQLYPNYPDQIMVVNPANYACRKGLQKLYLILIEDEAS